MIFLDLTTYGMKYDAGYQLIAINQRGILGSSSNLVQITLRDLANEVTAIADKMGVE